jgi:hypothetical protein
MSPLHLARKLPQQQHTQTRMSVLPRYIFAVLVAVFCYANALQAQTTANFRVPLNRAEITQSNIILFQNALYRWTVRGRGSAGQVIATPTQVDARFFVNNLNIVQGVANPRMPLDVNNTATAQYCTAFASTPAASPCNVYLAANMTRTSTAQPAVQNRNFRLTDAVQMKQYAFLPDNDTYNPNNIYSATVQGANLPAQMIFVDRLGFNSNAAYKDNEDTLSVRIERQSPELVLSARPSFAIASTQPARILNDDRPQQPFRDTVLDFGSFLVGKPTQSKRIVLYNRGSEALGVRIEAQDPSGIFNVFSPSGNIGTQQFITRGNDSLELFLTYEPRLLGTQTLDVRIITNDPALEVNGQSTFRLRLIGATVNGALLITPNFLPFLNNTLLFGTTQGDDLSKAFSELRGSFRFERAPTVQSTIYLDSVQQNANSAFQFATSPSLDPLLVLPDSLASSARSISTVIFRPTKIGDYLDSIIIRGRNLEDYTIYFRGRAELADAAIERTTAPFDVDTLDFGSLVTGASAVRSVAVRNVGNLPLTIQAFLDTGGDAKEFTVLQSTGNLPETTGSIFTASIRYDALTQYPIGQKQTFFFVVVRNTATGSIVAERRYTLRAQRLPNVLAAARSSVNFDSVYVQRERLDTTLIRNISGQYAATVDSQGVTSLSPNANREFTADTLGVVASARRFGVGTSGIPGLRYRPLNRGADSADFRLRSRVDSTNGAEELTVRLLGVGVEQDISVARLIALTGTQNSVFAPVSSTSSSTGYRVYTADIGCVRLGESRTVGVVVQNRGNLAFRIAGQFRTDSMNLSRAFTVDRPFTVNRNLAPNGNDTSLAVRFTPQTLGVESFTYVLESNIKRRVPSAPDSTEQIIIVLRGRGIVPQALVQDNLRFEDNTLGSQCSVQKDLPLLVRNPLSDSCGVPLVIKSVTISAGVPTGGTPFLATPSKNLPLTIQPATADTIKISFDPKLVNNTVGSYTATLLILTDAPSPNDSIRVTVSGNVVNQPSIIVSAPRNIRASPGKRIGVPISITPSMLGSLAQNAQALRSVSIAKFALTFDESLLAYRGFEELGTASEGAVIAVQQNALAGFDRTIQVTITTRDQSLRPTLERLLVLNFDTYLGRRTTTPLTFSNISFGDASCTIRAQVETTTNGSFTLDSVCGLEAKVRAIDAATFLLTDISPNPASENIRVSFQVAYQTRVTVEILDALGQVKATVTDNEFPEGAFEGEVSAANLSPGVYFCRMRAGRFSDMRKMVILR